MLTRINHCVELGGGGRVESKLKLAAIWVVAAVSGGAIGGFAGVALSSWLTDSPKILGADWWDLFTAFGTVGAVFFAAGLAVYQRIKEEDLRAQESVPIRYAVQPELYRLANRLTSSYWIISNHLRQLRDWPRLQEDSVRKLDALEEAAGLEACKLLLDRLHRLPPDECRAISLVMGNIHFCVNANKIARAADGDDPSYEFFVDRMIAKLKIYRDVSGYLITSLEQADFQGKRDVLRLLNDVVSHKHWLNKTTF